MLVARSLCLITVLVVSWAQESSRPTWTYRDQHLWSLDNPECGGFQQSPIDLNLDNSWENPKLSLKFHRFSANIRDYDVVNNGRGIRFDFKGTLRDAPAISGSAVHGNRYVLDQFHFHWGQKNRIGSEHTIDGARYDMELHLVLYNRNKFSNFQKALDSHKGVVVLAVLFEAHKRNRDRLNPLIKTIHQMANRALNQSIPLKHSLKLSDFMPDLNNQQSSEEDYRNPSPTSFFRYQGSLTTPPCTEGVTWLVMRAPKAIGNKQLEAFRAIKNFYHRTEGNNFRELQELNGRKIEVSGW